MYQEERVKNIIEYLEKSQKISTKEIMTLCNVSKDTARRDAIAALNTGRATRVHGGLMLSDNTKVLNYWQRIDDLKPNKERIASKVENFLEADQVIFLDVSTILFLVAKKISIKCKIYTHALDSAFCLAQNHNVDLHLFGGALDADNRFFFENDIISKLENISFDTVVLGAASLAKDGVYYKEADNAYLKREITKRASQVIVVAENQKFAKKANYKGVKYSDIDIFITDEELTTEQSAFFNLDKTQIVF